MFDVVLQREAVLQGFEPCARLLRVDVVVRQQRSWIKRGCGEWCHRVGLVVDVVVEELAVGR